MAPGKTINFLLSAFTDTVGIHQGSIIVSREEGGEAMQEIPVLLHVVEDAGLVYSKPMSKLAAHTLRQSLEHDYRRSGQLITQLVPSAPSDLLPPPPKRPATGLSHAPPTPSTAPRAPPL